MQISFDEEYRMIGCIHVDDFYLYEEEALQ